MSWTPCRLGAPTKPAAVGTPPTPAPLPAPRRMETTAAPAASGFDQRPRRSSRARRVFFRCPTVVVAAARTAGSESGPAAPARELRTGASARPPFSAIRPRPVSRPGFRGAPVPRRMFPDRPGVSVPRRFLRRLPAAVSTLPPRSPADPEVSRRRAAGISNRAAAAAECPPIGRLKAAAPPSVYFRRFALLRAFRAVRRVVSPFPGVVERLKVIISAPPSTVLTADHRCRLLVCGTGVCGCAAAG